MRSRSRTALVTGAARGLGAETAKQLAAKGCCVLLVDLCSDDPAIPYRLSTRDDLERQLAACRAIADSNQNVDCFVGDVRRQEDMDAAVHTAIERFGRLDIAVAAAGVIAGGPFAWDTQDDVWRVILDVNLTGTWHLARAAIPAMLSLPEPRNGRFVAVSSVAGLRGFPQLAAYAAAKHGVIGLVRSMAAELGSSGVTANVVCPGSMDTALLKASAEIFGLSDPGEFAKHHPSGRLVDCREVAGLIVWLCSSESSGITGAVLAVDGGFTAR